MQRGEVWWVEFDERRPVVLLSEDGSAGFVAMQVVAPADADFSDLGVEVAVGVREGLMRLRMIRRLPPEHGRRLAGLFPDGRLVEIDDSYTLIPLDQPTRFAQVVGDFIAARRSVP